MSDLAYERRNLWAQASATTARTEVPEADDFARGFDEGRRTVETELASEREALLQMVMAAEALESPSPGRLAEMIIVAVERLVSDVAGAMPVDAALLSERAEALAGVIANSIAPTLFVHPDDVALLDIHRLDLAVATDAGLARGSMQVRASGELAEDGVQSALWRLREQIAAMGVAL